MSQEVYEMITRLDRERIETHLVVQCAPMISGMKVSNLLNVEKIVILSFPFMQTGVVKMFILGMIYMPILTLPL